MMKINELLIVGTLLLTANQAVSQGENVVWMDDFEDDWTQNWFAESGTWEVGIPTSGPDSAHSASSCAATILDGNYGYYVDSRLVRFTSFTVPLASENPRLRFWHWFRFQPNDDDWGKVQLKVVGSDEWIDVSGKYNDYSTIWSLTGIDLNEFAGKTVQVAFFFHSDSGYEGSGWYIDDISMETGPYQFNNPENWETGIGDWYAESGSWEVGIPTDGPDSAHSGKHCVGTDLNGAYDYYVDSRFVSPPVIIPEASDNPRLRFWNWFRFQPNDDDWGRVQVKLIGSDEWVDVSGSYNDYSKVWTLAGIDLKDFAGDTVQVAFFFHSDSGYEGSGWYIDDISIEIGPYQFHNPEDWETGIGDWYAESGSWEVGVPTSGPDSAYSGEQCMGTNLNGNYDYYVDSRFISAPVTIPEAIANPRLRFWHWFRFQPNDDDWGKVQLRVIGSEEWVDVSGIYNDNSTVWTYMFVDLVPYAGQTVQVGFFFHSDGGYESSGWFVDDILIEDNSDLSVDAGPDFNINSGHTATMDPAISGGTEPYDIQWTPSRDLDDPSSLSAVAHPVSSTTYYLKVTDLNGCFRTDEAVVYVTHIANYEASILSYSLNLQSSVVQTKIDTVANSVDIVVESGTDIANLIATFTLSDGATATVNDVPQISGLTPNDFSNSLNYRVSAEDGTIRDWIVSVDIASGIMSEVVNHMTIFPNPTNSRAIIKFKNPNNSSFKMIVTNMSGTKVFEMDNIVTDRFEFYRESLPEGVYIIELTGEGVSFHNILLVN